jgi:serine/threonine-protein kinase
LLHRQRSRLLALLSRFDDARAELVGLVARIDRAYGAESKLRGELEVSLGDLDHKVAHLDDAEAHYQRALAIYTKTGGDIEVAESLVGLGTIALDLGKMKLAHECFERAKQAAEHALPGSERVLSTILTYLGDALGAELAAAQRELERAREIRIKLYGSESLFVGQVENTLGTNYTWLGQHDKAMEYLRHAIAVEERALGESSLDVLYAHHNLANDLDDQERYSEALAEHEHALAGLDKLLGKDHPGLTAPLAVMAYEYAVTGRAAEGIAAAERAHAIRASRHESDGAWLQFGWGVALWATDRARAVALVRSAVAIWHKQPDDPAALRHAEAWLASHR